MRTLAATLALAAAGCVTPATYGTQVAKATCDKLDECDALVGDLDTCVDAWTEGMACFEDHCTTFDADAATECLGRISDADCDGTVDPSQDPTCTDAWSDCSTLELGACIATAVLGLDD